MRDQDLIKGVIKGPTEVSIPQTHHITNSLLTAVPSTQDIESAYQEKFPRHTKKRKTQLAETEQIAEPIFTLTAQLLSDDPLFFLINSYTTGLSPSAMGYILTLKVSSRFGGYVECDEVGIPVSEAGACLPCGSAARWVSDKK